MIHEHLKKLAGFQDLFGKLSFCDCEECQSILGPTAYFVDLMKYIDDNLLLQFDKHPNRPLDLKVRRPDLWALELSSDSTNDRIPTLELVNEILENSIARRRGYTGPLTDRTAIGKLVYGQTLSHVIDSFHKPFHLPLAHRRHRKLKRGPSVSPAPPKPYESGKDMPCCPSCVLCSWRQPA